MREPERRFVQAGDIRLHYLEWAGDDPAVVLLVGTGMPAATLVPFAAGLPPRRRLAFDLRGHGESDKPPQGYRTLDFVADLHAALGALGIERPDAVGHSLGGAVLAAFESAHPGAFRRLVLIDPSIGPPGEAGFGDRSLEIAERTRKKRDRWPSREALLESYRTKDIFRGWREDALRAYVWEGTYLGEDGQAHLKCPTAIEAQVFEDYRFHDRWADISRLHLPVLLLRGSKTYVIDDQLAREMLARLPDAREALMPGLSHFPPMEDPEGTAAIVGAFLS
jgi:pimeloyl-ACP methyl ester carboxylesterase